MNGDHVHPNPTEQRHLDELLSAMRGKCVEVLSPMNTISSAFAQEFRTTLLIHHYFLKAPLATTSFEAAFLRAAHAAGHAVSPAPDGNRFWDLELDGRKVSLKSTAPATMSVGKLHVSKLCEAAWIQDVRSPAKREEKTKWLFEEYCASVDSIIQLRLFRGKAFYEMVEIPTSLLEQVQEVPRTFFAADGPTIRIPVGKSPPDFTLKLDRSDAKITLAGINKDVCNVLATWHLDASVDLVAPPGAD